MQHAEIYKMSIKNWTDAKTVVQNIPGIPEDLTAFLTRQSMWKIKDQSFYHLLFIYSYRLAGDEIPVEMVKDNIREMIINKRKAEFIRKMENDVYTDGVINNKFTIYENN